jgi:hypothetical protein
VVDVAGIRRVLVLHVDGLTDEAGLHGGLKNNHDW